MQETASKRISIAILALGGQGGGVLADWIQMVGRAHGWHVQGTSVPGVAQRTGSTVYYVELAQSDDGRAPILAQMPLAGDVDIVVASELMETGRAILRGFSTAERTTLIGSTHRIYAIGEKSAMGDGRASSERILGVAPERSKRFIGFDMEAATDRSGSVISSVMFGALAGSAALPFPRESFERAISEGGKAVASNLKGFAEGFTAAQCNEVTLPKDERTDAPNPSTETGKNLDARLTSTLPQAAWTHARHGVARLMDYQDAAYATQYLDRLADLARHDTAPFEMTVEAARHLALWMSYEDTIRVADLKVRGSRSERVKGEVRLADEQLMTVTEFMHPRLREVCETLPSSVGRAILNSRGLTRLLGRFFKKGRHVEVTSLRWFFTLRLLAGMRRFRRHSLRYAEEQARITAWLATVEKAACDGNLPLATELVKCQRLIKGYGDTFERGLRNFEQVMDLYEMSNAPAGQKAEQVKAWREAALADPDGKALACAA